MCPSWCFVFELTRRQRGVEMGRSTPCPAGGRADHGGQRRCWPDLPREGRTRKLEIQRYRILRNPVTRDERLGQISTDSSRQPCRAVTRLIYDVKDQTASVTVLAVRTLYELMPLSSSRFAVADSQSPSKGRRRVEKVGGSESLANLWNRASDRGRHPGCC